MKNKTTSQQTASEWRRPTGGSPLELLCLSFLCGNPECGGVGGEVGA